MPPIPTELHQRCGPDLHPTIREDEEIPPELPNGQKVVGVDGKWYDVTYFLPLHPGGPVLEQFVGHDASQVFQGYGHNPDVLKRCKIVGTYRRKTRHSADEDFEKLREFFQKEGYYKTDWMFYAQKIFVVFCLFATAFALVIGFESWYIHYLGAVVLAFFWQQSGFVMHEFMHSQVFRKRNDDRCGGLLFGTVFFGMSAHWWQDEHIFHHAMTNTVDVASRFVDPQMWEATWAQNEKLFPLFKGWLQYYLIKIQHITFVPVVVLCGRFEIVIDSYRLERRWYEWIAVVLHWVWMTYLLSWLPTWREVCIFYIIAASVEGIFHFQLILSHYCRAFSTVEDFHRTSWYEFQILSNLNIEIPTWQDWYYGGLNFHIEHHLFPTMARKHLRSAAAYVEPVCRKHGIKYESVPFCKALVMTLSHLRRTGSHYKLDPR